MVLDRRTGCFTSCLKLNLNNAPNLGAAGSPVPQDSVGPNRVWVTVIGAYV